jgi:hypothetical protein
MCENIVALAVGTDQPKFMQHKRSTRITTRRGWHRRYTGYVLAAVFGRAHRADDCRPKFRRVGFAAVNGP